MKIHFQNVTFTHEFDLFIIVYLDFLQNPDKCKYVWTERSLQIVFRIHDHPLLEPIGSIKMLNDNLFELFSFSFLRLGLCTYY